MTTHPRCARPPAPAPSLTDLGPLAQLRAGRLGRRLPQLVVGLVLYGVSLAMMVRGDLGLAPWDVLHSGLAAHVPLTLGPGGRGHQLRGAAAVDPAAGGARAWARSRNAVVIGLAADAALAVLATPDALGLARRC